MEMLLEKERKSIKKLSWRRRRKKEREEAKKKKEEQQRKRLEKCVDKVELRAKKAAQREEKTWQKKGKAIRWGDSDPQSSVPAKRACIEICTQDVINDSECCVCYVAYEDDTFGMDWVECACRRWLHKDSADDCVIDEGENEWLCFVYLHMINK